MKTLRFLLICVITVVSVLSPLTPSVGTTLAANSLQSCTGLVKVPGLTAASTVGESGDYAGNAPPGNLTNEQSAIGDPPTASPTSMYRPGFGGGTKVYVNLGAVYCIKKLYWFDDIDLGAVNLYTGTPGNWTFLTSLNTDLYPVWQSKDLTATNTQYLRFEFVSTTTFPQIGEIAIYAGGAGATNTPTNTSVGPTNTPTNTPVGPTNTPTNTSVATNTPTNTSAGGCTGLVKVPGLTATSTVGESGDYGSNAPPGNMTNEQSAIGDPPSANPTSLYRPGFGGGTKVYVNLGAVYCIKKLYWWDGQDLGTVNLYTGTPGSWTLLTSINTDLYQVWQSKDLTETNTQYLRFEFVSTSTFPEIGEVAIYAGGSGSTPTPTNTPTNTPVGPTNTSTNTPVATNTHTNTPVATNTPTNTPVGPTNTPTNTPASGCSGLVKVPGLTSSSTVGESGDYGSNAPPGNMTNEQSAIGDPPSANPTSMYRPGFGGGAKVYVNLGAVYCIKRLYWWDGQDLGTVNLYTGAPGNWTLLTNFTNDLYQTWQFKDLTATNTQYLRFEFVSPANFPEIGEVAIYAGGSGVTATPSITPTPTNTLTPTKTPTFGPSPTPPPNGCRTYFPKPSITVDQFIGVNSFIDVPDSAVAPFGNIREYHPWNWDEGDTPNSGVSYPGYPNDPTRWNPMYAGGGWNFDGHLASLNGLGILVSPAIMDGVYWLHTDTQTKPTYPQNASQTDPVITENPNSYIAHADHMYQTVARYGNNVVPDANLKLDVGQARSTGLGYVQYYEDWNEPDRWWLGGPGAPGNFKPSEDAAMMSADFDAHCGAMTSNLGYKPGVKYADPNARMVMGGLAGAEGGQGTSVTAYLDGIKAWSNTNRGGSLPFDVINFHHYSGNGSIGLSPEADDLKGFLQGIINWRNTNAPNMEVWYSEFGWDTNQGSPRRAPPIGPFNPYQVQGQWIIRAYLASLAVGIDRDQVFDIRDGNPNSGVQFDTSGLTWYCSIWSGCSSMPGHTNYEPKPAWNYIYTMKTRLTGMKWRAEQTSGNPNVLIYTFKNNSTGAGGYVLWAPTSNGTTVAGYQLTLQGSPTSATQVTLSDTSSSGNSSALTITAGKVTVNVSESPIFVLVNSIP